MSLTSLSISLTLLKNMNLLSTMLVKFLIKQQLNYNVNPLLTMLFLRSILYFIGSIVSVILIAFCSLVLVFSPYSIRYKVISKWAFFCIWWLKITLNITINIIGKNNITDSPCIITSNHQSTWETLAFQTIFPAHTWVLKKELLWLPIFGWSIALLKPIIIDRGDKLQSIKKVIKQGKDRLNMASLSSSFLKGQDNHGKDWVIIKMVQ